MVSYSEYSLDRPEGHLYYYRAGQGKEVLLLFHGFGQNHTAFDPLIETLTETFTLYSFDLFFHGKSTWLKDEEPLEKQAWKSFMTDFIQKNNIEKFSIGGFSLGGKFALATAEAFPEKTKKLFLFAPDGIRTNPWYSLATYPLIIRRLFKSMIHQPARFFFLVKLTDRLKITDKSMARFVENQMNTIEKRKQVYFTWVVFRHLKFSMEQLGLVIDRYAISTVIVTGKFDHVIKSENMRYLANHSKQVVLKQLECGHNKLLNHPSLPKTILESMHSE